jgi:hypothetical protein
VLGYTGYYLLLVLAIAGRGAALPVLIIGTIPLWIMLLGKPQGCAGGAGAGLAADRRGHGADDAATADEVQAAAMVTSGAVCCWRLCGGHAQLDRLRPAQRALAAPPPRGELHRSGPTGSVWPPGWARWASGCRGVRRWANWGPARAWACLCWCVRSPASVSAWVAAVLWNMASRRLSASLAGQLIVSETVFA